MQVVSETYEELVFSEPTETFWRRVGERGVQPAPEPQLSCLANVSAFNPQVCSAAVFFCSSTQCQDNRCRVGMTMHLCLMPCRNDHATSIAIVAALSRSLCTAVLTVLELIGSWRVDAAAGRPQADTQLATTSGHDAGAAGDTAFGGCDLIECCDAMA